MKNVIIACGGTGGHLTPGIALAQSLEEKGCKAWLFISRKKVDSRLSSKYPTLTFVSMPGAALNKTPLGIIGFLKGFISSYLQSKRFYKKVQADAMVGFGGFTSLGPAVAARVQKIPLFIHEANRTVGKAVRLIARNSDRVYLPEGVVLEGLSPEVIKNIGYPLRKEFRRIPRERARKHLGIPSSDRLLVVLGGSQGAASLNKWVKKNLSELAKEGISTLCITGMGKDSSGVVQLDGPTGEIITSRFVAFTDEMNVLLSAADLVVSRAGAGAIAEIVRCRVPSILVPYPYAADNHQFHNARFLEVKGGGLVCPDEELMEKMFKEVQEMMFNEELRAILRRNLFSMDGGDVGARLADDINQLVSERKISQNAREGGVEVYA